MSKFKFKQIVKEQITQKACEYLTELQMKHSKSLFLHQESSMKEYLTTDQLTVAQKQLLFKLRSRVTPNKSNYKNKYKNDMSCTLKKMYPTSCAAPS